MSDTKTSPTTSYAQDADPEQYQVGTVDDDSMDLGLLSYKQELKKTHTIWSLVAFGIVTLTPASAISNTLQIPLLLGGPQALVWGYIIVSVFTMLVAISLAEISAAFPPTSGAMLSWSYLLPKSKTVKVLASWYTGYFNIFAQIAFAASASFQGCTMILGLGNLNNPSYVPERFHYVLASMGFIILFTLTNIFGSKFHADTTKYLLAFNIATVSATMITLLVTADERRDAKFIFTEYSNSSGFSSHSYVFILGLLQSAYTFTGYDAVTHLAEEASPTRRSGHHIIPKALVTVVGTSIVYGFIFVVVVCATIDDIDSLVNSSTGSAFIQLLLNATNSKQATTFFAAVPAILALFAAETMTLANSRTIYSFARDGAFIFPQFFSKVSDKWGVPIPALLFSMCIQCVIVILYFSSDVVFNTILSLCTIGHEVAYLIPICCMLFGGRARLSENRSWNLGIWGVICNVISFCWLVFISITMFFPTEYPVTSGNMNYTIVIFFLVVAYATLCYVFQGVKTYKGPTDILQLEEERVELENIHTQGLGSLKA
jgi:amino acid transporter